MAPIKREVRRRGVRPAVEKEEKRGRTQSKARVGLATELFHPLRLMVEGVELIWMRGGLTVEEELDLTVLTFLITLKDIKNLK